MILGLGNELLGDDGIGLVAAGALRDAGSEEVTVISSPLSGMYLIDLVEGFDDLIVIDSIPGRQPGRVVSMDLRSMGPSPVPSAHYAGLAEALAAANAAGMQVPGRVAVVGVEIGTSLVIGDPISSPVSRALTRILRAVRSVAMAWGYRLEGGPAAASRRGADHA